MNFANDILDAIEIMVKQVVEDNATKIYTGVCKTIGVNDCVLTINGKDNTVKYYGGVPVVGTVYQVFIPFGNMSAAFIIVPGSGGGSGSSGVDSVNGKTGDVVLTATDVGALPTSGGTLTGNLTVGSASINTNGYVVGTWLQGTATNHLTNAATKIAVQDGSGWVYHRTAEEIKSDIGLSNVDNVKQYSASNPPPYPVASVNGKTGGVSLVASDVGAAPAGYGLGGYSRRLTADDNIDTIMANGWYYWEASNAPQGTLPTTLLPYARQIRVTNEGGTCYQEAVDTSDSYTHGCMIRRTMYGTAVYPWEWVNPPMMPDTEYRTTERYQGKPVYVKLIDVGQMPNTQQLLVSASIGGNTETTVIGFDGYMDNGASIDKFPVFWSPGELKAYMFVMIVSGIWQVGVRSLIDLSAYTAKCLIKYIKTEG